MSPISAFTRTTLLASSIVGATMLLRIARLNILRASILEP